MADLETGRRLARYRAAAGLTQEQAAARWRVSGRTASHWESRGVADSYAGLIAALLDDVGAT